MNVLLSLWLFWMLWEVIDQHPDHVLAYSVIFLSPIVWRISYSGRSL